MIERLSSDLDRLRPVKALITGLKQTGIDIKVHRAQNKGDIISLCKHVIYQNILLWRRGVTASEYYYQKLWRKNYNAGGRSDFIGALGTCEWQNKINNQSYTGLMEDKLLFSSYASGMNIPIPPTLGIYSKIVPGIIQPVFKSWDEAEFWLIKNEGNVFVKPLFGAGGKQTLSLGRKIEADEPAWQCLPEGSVITLSEIKKYIQEGEYEDYIFEKRLMPSAQLQNYSKDVLQTVRIITYIREGEVNILGAALKISAGKSSVDNLVSGKNMVAPVDLETGELGSAVILNGYNPDRIDCHPVTQAPITGVVLEDWEEVIRMVIQAAQAFPWIKSVGWDVGMAMGGPVIVEANSTGDSLLLQISHDRGLLSWPEFKNYIVDNNLQNQIGLGLHFINLKK
ncbi:MAG: sugar-transfer associated ATP-grasp domain-containing protein [Pontibacterium sp.]